MEESIRDMSFRLARYDRNIRKDLIEKRRSLGLSQKDIAKRLGVSTRWVNRIERYDSDPRLSEMRRYKCAIYAKLESDDG